MAGFDIMRKCFASNFLEIATLIADEVSVCVQMVEVHPTFDRLEVSLVHLNEHR